MEMYPLWTTLLCGVGGFKFKTNQICLRTNTFAKLTMQNGRYCKTKKDIPSPDVMVMTGLKYDKNIDSIRNFTGAFEKAIG